MNKPVIVEELINASVEKIWQAITDKDKMKQWYFDLSDFKPVVGFEFSFPGQGIKDETYIHLCKITEVVPLQKLQYSWRYENYPGNSFVTFELIKEGDKTRVRVTHEGLESFPEVPSFARENFVAGWTELITKLLKDFVTKTS